MSGIKKSEHRNAARSRRLIKQAFGELLNEKDLHKITVTDIVERANISRGTFYAHYLDVYDLNAAIQNNIMETLDYVIQKSGSMALILDPTPFVRDGMLFLEQNKTYYALFTNSSQGEIIVDRVISYVLNLCAPVIVEKVPPADLLPVKAFVTYSLGAFKRVVLSWFSGELEASAQEIASYMSEFYLNSRPPQIIALQEDLVNAGDDTPKTED